MKSLLAQLRLTPVSEAASMATMPRRLAQLQQQHLQQAVNAQLRAAAATADWDIASLFG